MTDTVERPVDIDLRFDVPLYTLAEAARALGVPATTFTTWARGYQRHPPGRKPVSGSAIVTALDATGPGQPAVPFVGLAEGVILAAVRRAGVPLQRVRPHSTFSPARSASTTRSRRRRYTQTVLSFCSTSHSTPGRTRGQRLVTSSSYEAGSESSSKSSPRTSNESSTRRTGTPGGFTSRSTRSRTSSPIRRDRSGSRSSVTAAFA